MKRKKWLIIVGMVCMITVFIGLFSSVIMNSLSSLSSGKKYKTSVVLDDGLGGTNIILNPSYSNRTSGNGSAKTIVANSIRWLGTKYVFGGKGGLSGGSTSGVDCSGLIAWSLHESNYKFSRF